MLGQSEDVTVTDPRLGSKPGRAVSAALPEFRSFLAEKPYPHSWCPYRGSFPWSLPLPRYPKAGGKNMSLNNSFFQ